MAEKIAVIGTGAAAFGVVAGLKPLLSKVQVDLIGPDAARTPWPREQEHPMGWSPADYDDLHRIIHAQVGRKFPPPRTLFGTTLERFPVEGKGALWKSSNFGGLGNFWSGSMFPLAEGDFDQWQTTAAELAPYYRQIADLVGVSGQADAFDEYYGNTYVNRPPIACTPLSRRLVEGINSSGRQGTTRLFAGINRLAIETRPDQATSCVACGECMYGCFRDSLFRPGVALRRMVKAGQLGHISATLHRMAPLSSGGWRLHFMDGETANYDRVFLSAGAIATTEILLHSFGIRDEAAIEDNALYIFPILLPFSKIAPTRKYLSIANIAVGCVDETSEHPYSQAHIAPFPDYLVSYYAPMRAVRAAAGLMGIAKSRILFGKLYIDGSHASRYSLRASVTGNIERRRVSDGNANAAASHALGAIKKALSGTGFWMPPFPLLRTATSSHYTGPFAGGCGGLRAKHDGEISPGLYIADSAAFPRTPAQPLTFTIMANASRVATTVLS